MRRRAERCAPSEFVALTGAPAGTSAQRHGGAAASCASRPDVGAGRAARAATAPASDRQRDHVREAAAPSRATPKMAAAKSAGIATAA